MTANDAQGRSKHGGPHITIRDATPADAEIITRFNVAMALESEGLRLDHAVASAGVRRILEDGAKGRYFLAEIDAGVVGQTMVTAEWSDWRNGWIWWIQSVFVEKSDRGKGVFSALYGHIRTLADSRPDVCALRLYVHGDNAPAIHRYERLGMNQTAYLVYEDPTIDPRPK